MLFLCCVTVFLLTGNQLFENVRITDLQNARALEGSQHVSYYGITLAEFEKIKECSFTAQAGRSISLGQAEDGTSFAYIDENFRDLSAAVADGNLKQTIEGRWAEKENVSMNLSSSSQWTWTSCVKKYMQGKSRTEKR